MPLARIRRQSPRYSPSSTREFGPIDAMIRDCLLAPERTMTQCRETERTHRDAGRFGNFATVFSAEAAVVTGLAATGLDGAGSIVGDGGWIRGAGSIFGAESVFGVASAKTVVGPSGVTLSTGGRAARLSFAAKTARAIARSLSSGVEGAAFAVAATDAALGRGGGALFDAAFWISQTPAITAAAPIPSPRQIFASIGGRSG